MSSERAPSSAASTPAAAAPANTTSASAVEFCKGVNGLEKLVLRESRGSSAEVFISCCFFVRSLFFFFLSICVCAQFDWDLIRACFHLCDLVILLDYHLVKVRIFLGFLGFEIEDRICVVEVLDLVVFSLELIVCSLGLSSFNILLLMENKILF